MDKAQKLKALTAQDLVETPTTIALVENELRRAKENNDVVTTNILEYTLVAVKASALGTKVNLAILQESDELHKMVQDLRGRTTSNHETEILVSPHVCVLCPTRPLIPRRVSL